VELNGIELLVHNTLNNLPNGLKQADSAVVTAALWDQDYYDSAPELLEHCARLPDCSDQLHQQAQQVPCTVIALVLFCVFFPPYSLEPLLDVLGMHHQSVVAASIGKVACKMPHFRVGGCAVQD
jgi:hypothetical protein